MVVSVKACTETHSTFTGVASVVIVLHVDLVLVQVDTVNILFPGAAQGCPKLLLKSAILNVHRVVLHLSSSLQLCCPSSGHRDNVMSVLGFLCVCVSSRSVCQHSLMQLLPSFALLHLSSCRCTVTFDLCATPGCPLPPSYLLILTDFYNFSEELNAALFAAAESALMLFAAIPVYITLPSAHPYLSFFFFFFLLD